MKKIRMGYTILASLALFALYCVIFGFSAQDGETSGGLSLRISRMGIEFWNELTGKNWTEGVIARAAAYFEHPLRKLAHFAEYAVMGALVHSLWACWGRRGKKWLFVSGIWVMVSAAADELHQYFVPGRSGNLPDVLLDTCGGIFGAASCALFAALLGRGRHGGGGRGKSI